MRRDGTIFALSSGAPPAAIAIVRISGPAARDALTRLAGGVPAPRCATLKTLRRPGDGAVLDRALVLWFPATQSATGEDLAELHVHGGRAVVAAVGEALASIAGLRPAEPGEFTRRAFLNGRIDLAEAEGLADLLAAETEAQRRQALAVAGGGLSRQVEMWRGALLGLAARVEALLDFSDEGDVGSDEDQVRLATLALADEIDESLAHPPAERLRDGLRVVIAGPPNAGKSSLFNALVGREAAIAAPRAGTTRDLIEAPIDLGGIPLILIDSAGLREGLGAIEREGVVRARSAVAAADMVLWLGATDACPDRAILVHAKADLPRRSVAPPAAVAISTKTGTGLPELRHRLLDEARRLLPPPDRVALNRRQRSELTAAVTELRLAADSTDLILSAEHLRCARSAFDRLTGRADVEAMLDALFGRFCIGK